MVKKQWHELWNQLVCWLQSKRVFKTTLDNFLLKFLFILSLGFTIFWVLPSERPFEYRNLTVGSIAPEEIIAPFTFPIIKTPEELEAERREAWLNVPPVFSIDKKVPSQQQLRLRSFFKNIREFFQQHPLNSAALEQMNKGEFQSAEVDSFVQNIFLKYAVNLNQRTIAQLFTLYKSKRLNQFENNLLQGISEAYSRGILDRSKAEIQEKQIAIQDNGIEEVVGRDEVFDLKEAATHVYLFLQNQYPEGAPELEIANYLIPAMLFPNLSYNAKITEARKEKAVHDVPQTRGFVYKNQRIIDSHEIVTEDVYRKLQSLDIALRERSAQKGRWETFRFQLGKVLFSAAVLILLGLFLFYYRREFISNNKMFGLITLILLLQFWVAYLVVHVLNWPPWSIPIILAPMLLSILLDAQTAFIGAVVTALVVGASNSNDYLLGFMAIVVGSVALYSVQKIRHRMHMFRAILLVVVAYLGVDLVNGFIHFESGIKILRTLLYYGLPNAVLTPTAVYFLIGLFERAFDVTTDITLLELSDLNHPLLKRLSVEAPGTFHHSILVGNLAEAAAIAVGANALLTRVGCYYHDIGKMTKPEYFIENQMGALNRHDTLSPRMSALILINHVKAGLELADQYKLPRAVKQFIPEHHGTSLITYFYNKALETGDPKEIDENQFRYPGPKPRSKETAIAMLADTVEAACRTLQNPTPQRIRSLVDSLVERKIKEGQLDESDLTLREINQIKEAFVPILVGIHHSRIEYPGEPGEKKAEKLRAAEKAAVNPGSKQSESKSAKPAPAAATSHDHEAEATDSDQPA
ncbi:MAG: HDIG domain-containing protein [Calditrichaeota bacterium]|nr:MAG: HDIG domain-containing protein [Calditrichota bacterium]